MLSLELRKLFCLLFVFSTSLLPAAEPSQRSAAEQAALDKTKQDAALVEKLHIDGKFTEAEKLSAQILATRIKLLGENHLDTASAYNCMALARLARQSQAE